MTPPRANAPPPDPTGPTEHRNGKNGETLAGSRKMSARDPIALVPGVVLGGRFRIVAKLREGGMGEVYRAEDLKLGQTVALKFLSRRSEQDPTHRRRLLAEVRLGRSVAHPSVCRVFDIVELGGRAFVVMEYVDGEDLASLLRRIERLPPERGLAVARELCAGLAAIHDQGIVHRDLKPANVMLDASGRVRITDFGLASELGGEGERSGTPAYMAPEQLRGEPPAPATDVYAFGLVCYEILSGQRVFAGGASGAIEARQRPLSLPPAPGLSAEVRSVVEACLAYEPQARPRNARAILGLLPGADPLAAAVAAGETPSPEMVAAAEDVGSLPRARAGVLLALVIGGLACTMLLSTQALLIRRAAPSLSPSALERLAGEVLASVGVELDSPGSDRVGWFEVDRDYLDHLAASGDPDPWLRLRQPPHPLRYHFRFSPRPLVARDQLGMNRVTSDDPPPLVPGMVEVVQGADGRLRRLTRVPPPLVEPRAIAALDWRPLLERAGLDPDRLVGVEAEATAPVDTDRKWAWTEPGADAETPVRVEAASHGGRVVYLALVRPWDAPGFADGAAGTLGLAAGSTPARRIALAVSLVFLLVLPPFAYLLARRNLRRRRVDLRGASKAGLLCFASLVLGRALLAHHVPVFVEEWATASLMVAESVFWALNAGLFYVAVEPFVRRR